MSFDNFSFSRIKSAQYKHNFRAFNNNNSNLIQFFN